MVLHALLLIPLAFLIAFPTALAARAVGRRIGALDTPGSRGHVKRELRPIPNTGGIAIFLAVAAPLGAAIAAILLLPPEFVIERLPSLEPFLDRLREGSEDGGRGGSVYTALAMLIGMTILHIMGLIDDRRGMSAFVKLAVQAAIAAALAIWFDVRLLELLGPVPSILITVVWVVVMTNAINFLDNMDGLAAGVGVIAASFLMAATLINQQWFIAGTLALLIGAQLGFLIWNFPPAKIFMGDSGSLVIGFLLAVLTARTTFFHSDLGGEWYGVFMPVVVLAIPLYDFISVTLLRLKQRKSPFVGDQQHFSHRLVERGLSKRSAVVLIWCFAAITGVGGIALGHLTLWQAVLVLAQTLLVLFTLVLLEHASRHRSEKPLVRDSDI